mmetsp:Transcript_2022/g.4577  ORF Transcript_2022/g.4577 Transcript_2022/m.4577 type:complete len:258 (-) Transcript_2022:371-1144(-)
MVSGPAARAIFDASSSFLPPIMSGKSAYIFIHLRSILSFHRHNFSPTGPNPPKDILPYDKTADLSPVVINPKNTLCGVKSTSASPSNARRRFFSSGGPCRTANTPAFGRGCFNTLATSPAAKMFLCDVDSSVGLTAMNPLSSSTSGVLSRNHLAAPACVHQIVSFDSIARPLCKINLPFSARITPSFSTTSTPCSANTPKNVFLTLFACVGIISPRVIKVNFTKFSSKFALANSRRMRQRMDNASSAPPAPPPTTHT